jgi:UDP-2,3-diacylglucosamine pyrophosphatase LpxH
MNLNIPLSSNKELFILGDHHGDYDKLFHILEHPSFKGVHIIHVGDGGEGFLKPKAQINSFEIINQKFKDLDITYYSIRGNHSDPNYFNGDILMSNFVLLPDYSTIEYRGDKILLVGGSISVDRKLRKEGISWWRDEVFEFKKDLIQECDTLITHSAPDWSIQNIDRSVFAKWLKVDPDLKEECRQEGELLASLVEAAKPRLHFCGHFHQYSFSIKENCKSRILAEMQMIHYDKDFL